MPELTTFNNIATKGLMTDPQPWSMPPEFITFGINYRILSGAFWGDGGSKFWSQAPVAYFPGHLAQIGPTSEDPWIIPGRNAVYSFDGTTWTDISSTAGYGNIGTDQELLWSSCLLGVIPIVNNPQAHPEFWSPQSPSQILQPLNFDQSNTWLDKGFTFNIIRSHKNFLFALNLTENAVDFPDSYRWSHPADINGLPATWDETDDAFLAGKASLGGDGGRIIDGKSMRDAFCIYSEKGIDILDYTNDEFVWRRRELETTVGLLSKECIAEVKGRHYFMADGDIFRNDGNKVESILHNKIRREFANRISADQFSRSYVSNLDTKKELWFCIPEAGEDYPNIAYIYNWRDESWSVRDIPDTVALARQGSRTVAVDQWDSLPDSDTWDNQIRTWASSTGSPLTNLLIGIKPATETLEIVTPDETPDDEYTSQIERTDFVLTDEVQVTTIVRVYPHVNSQTPIIVQFGSQDFPGAPVRWKPEQSFDPNTQRKIDVRTTGELHAFRFKTTGKIGWLLSGFGVEFERSGKR